MFNLTQLEGSRTRTQPQPYVLKPSSLNDYVEIFLIWFLVVKSRLSDFTIVYTKITTTQNWKVLSSPDPFGGFSVGSLDSGRLQNRSCAPEGHNELFST